MSKFNSAITTQTCTAPKGVFYGPPGCGKTTGAHKAGGFIIDCENGAGKYQPRTPYLETWPEIEEWLCAVEKENHGHKVIAIDTIDWLVRRLEEHVCGNSKTGQKPALEQTLNKSHGGYGNGKQVLKNYIYRVLLPQLDRIVNKGIAVILLAHAKRTVITNIDGIAIEKTTPDLPDDYLNTFVEWSDFVCLIRKDMDGNRALLTEEDSKALAKNRYNMPAAIPFTWKDFTNSISNGLNTKS